MQNNGLIQLRSPYTVSETAKRLQSALQAKGLNVFCAIDHSGEAEKVGLSMRPTRLIIFGAPKAGTPLMVVSPTLAIDLPLKALIAEDNTGQVWLSYNSPEYLKERHSIPNELIGNIAGIGGLLQSVVRSESEQQGRSDAAD